MEHNEAEPWALTSPLCMPMAPIPLGTVWFPGALQEHPRWMCVSVGKFLPLCFLFALGTKRGASGLCSMVLKWYQRCQQLFLKARIHEDIVLN